MDKNTEKNFNEIFLLDIDEIFKFKIKLNGL